jgi:hypothetical protein
MSVLTTVTIVNVVSLYVFMRLVVVITYFTFIFPYKFLPPFLPLYPQTIIFADHCGVILDVHTPIFRYFV